MDCHEFVSANSRNDDLLEGLKAPSLAEVVWGWVVFVLAKFALLDFAFARFATLKSTFS